MSENKTMADSKTEQNSLPLVQMTSSIIFDPNDVVGENINFGNQRSLDNASRIHTLFREFSSSKLKLQTLVDVFSAFLVPFNRSPAKKAMTFQTTYDKVPVYFNYDSKVWKATITKEYSDYDNDGRPTKFINIKLPLDGFVLTQSYAHPTNLDELKFTNETRDFGKLLESIVPFKKMEIDAYYKLQQSRLEFYFWNREVQDECVTIKFENGTYNHFVNRKRYTPDELDKMIQ